MEDNIKGTLIIADENYLPFLFEYCAKDLSKNITLWSTKDLFDNVGDKVGEDAISFLRKKGIGYGKAKKYLNLLCTADYTKNTKLSSRREELLENKRLIPNPLGAKRIQSYHVFLFERQEDIQVHDFLKRNGVSATDRSIDALKRTNHFTPLNHPNINLFSDKFHQFRYVFADIRKRLLETGPEQAKTSITIHINGQEDAFYLKNIGSLFDIPVIRTLSSPFLAEEGVKKKIEEFYQTKDFLFGEEELEDQNRKVLSSLIKRYKLDEIKEKEELGFSFAFSCLLEILNHQKRKSSMDSKGIRATDGFVFRPNQVVYVTDFVFPRFYNEFKDNNVLSDDELVKVSANPSYILTNLDKRRKKNYLSYRNIVLLSRVKQHLQDTIFPSPFLAELKEQAKNRKKEEPELVLPPLSTQIDYNSEGVYTTKARNIYLSSQRDSVFRFSKYVLKEPNQKEDTVFNGYDHSFRGLGKNQYPVPDHFSITNLESYVLCPFKYYLENTIPDQVQDYFSRFRGTRIHAVFESINHKDFDFDSAFVHGKEALKKDREKRGQAFDRQREATVENIRIWLKLIAGEIRNQVKENVNLIENLNDAEERIEFTLKDGNKEYQFLGSIDKIIFSEKEGRHFYTIVDYKTGSEDFVPMETLFGRSIQLPLYAYAIEQKRNEAKTNHIDAIPYRPNLKSTFGGFAIEHIYAPSPKNRFGASSKKPVLSKEGLDKKIRLSGAVLEDEDYLKSRTQFFTKGEEGEDEVTRNVAYKKDNSLDLSKRVFFAPVCTFTNIEEDSVKEDEKKKRRDRNQIFEDSKQSAIHIIHKLEKGEFPITPTSNPLNQFNKKNLPCRYCNYKDVCYHKASDAINYASEYKKIMAKRKKEGEEKKNG